MVETDTFKNLLDFISTLIWQILVVTLIFTFRKQIAYLLENLTSIKAGGAEAIFQRKELKAFAPGGEADDQIKNVSSSPGSFFSREGIIDLINKSDKVESKEEKVVDTLLLFQTNRQRTWLIVTNKQLFCILDDKNTRSNHKLIQWNLPLNEAKPVRITRHYKPETGLVNIGPRRNWLYSHALHPDPTYLEKDIEELLDRAQSSSPSEK